MALAPADFRGIVSLNQPLVEELTAFLREREGYLAEAIRHAFEGILEPIHADSNSLGAVLNALQTAKYIPSSNTSLSQLQNSLNAALWSFVEVLEGGVTELFQQLDETALQDWNDNLAEVVGALVALFQNHLQGAIHAISRLEDLLWRCRDYMQIGRPHSPWVRQILRCGRSLLDKQLLRNLDKALSFLDKRYHGWRQRYDTYLTFNARATDATRPLERYSLFQTLPEQSQHIYRYILRMVKLWEIDAGAKALLLEDIMRAVRDRLHSDTVYDVFYAYYQTLKATLFTTSKDIKVGGDTLPLGDIGLEIASLRKELTQLQRSVARYREFLLRTDPNPYVRSRWGFPEWVVGPEPESCRQLLQLEFQIEALDRLYSSFSNALIGKADESKEAVAALIQDIHRSLHALGQPLLSHHVMRAEGGRLMDKLLRFDELASTSPRAIDFVGEVLLKALRYDTKFSLLFDNSLFHKIYAIHHELAAPLISDAAHVQEVEKWKMHISRILKWLHKDHGEKQVGDIDILHQEATRHLNTIFESLREQVEPPAGEQAAKLQHSVNVIRQEILEFRYLLGDFYRHLGQTGLEERHLRGRFVTVDNQLEAIETALQSLDPDAIRLSY